MGMADGTPDDAIHTTCNPELHDAGDIWGGASTDLAISPFNLAKTPFGIYPEGSYN